MTRMLDRREAAAIVKGASRGMGVALIDGQVGAAPPGQQDADCILLFMLGTDRYHVRIHFDTAYPGQSWARIERWHKARGWQKVYELIGHALEAASSEGFRERGAAGRQSDWPAWIHRQRIATVDRLLSAAMSMPVQEFDE